MRPLSELRSKPSTETLLEAALAIIHLAKSGLYYSRDTFDRERFGKVLELATNIVAAVGDTELVRLRLSLAADSGPVTPKIAVRTAVFDIANRILLVREETDGLWSLPGGWCDSGYTPRQAAEKEVLEETGLKVEGLEYCGYFDQRVLYENPIFHIVCHYFVAQADPSAEPVAKNNEISAVAFFDRTALPPLSYKRVRRIEIDRLFEWKGGRCQVMFE